MKKPRRGGVLPHKMLIFEDSLLRQGGELPPPPLCFTRTSLFEDEELAISRKSIDFMEDDAKKESMKQKIRKNISKKPSTPTITPKKLKTPRRSTKKGAEGARNRFLYLSLK